MGNKKQVKNIIDVFGDRSMIIIDSYKQENTLNEGLVAYYPFTGNANDESGNGNDGTVVGATLTTDQEGTPDSAYSFDGNDYININPVVNDLAATTQGTLSAWVKPADATPPINGFFVGFGDTNVDERLGMLINLVNGEFRAFLRLGGITQWLLATDAIAFSDNIWTHVAVVQNGTEPVLYVDGVAVAQSFIISTDITSWFSDATGIDNGRIGAVNNNNLGQTALFNGSIDEVRIYNRALSESEILQLANL